MQTLTAAEAAAAAANSDNEPERSSTFRLAEVISALRRALLGEQARDRRLRFKDGQANNRIDHGDPGDRWLDALDIGRPISRADKEQTR